VSYSLPTIRAEFPSFQQCIYLNCGTYAPPAERVTQAVTAELLREKAAAFTLAEEKPRLWQLLQKVRDAIALEIDASTENIALTLGASYGINTVCWGINWQPDDEILISDEEHEANRLPWQMAVERFGAKLVRWELGADTDQTLDRLRALITPKTKLATFSHVSCFSGRIAPVAEMCALCRENNVLTCVDGAHALGQLPVSVPSIGCNFYVANLHKWICGPYSTGFLWVSPRQLEHLNPTFIGWFSVIEEEIHADPFSIPTKPTAERFEVAGTNWAGFAGALEALAWHREITLAAKQQHIAPLRADLKSAISEISGVELLSPENFAYANGLVTFRHRTVGYSELMNKAWESKRLVLRPVPEWNALRISIAFFTSWEDLQAVVDVLKAV
jgi:selenocysteine lyase/cysteine desulfurase